MIDQGESPRHAWWQDAWADETLAVVERVWRHQGFRFYYGPNRTLQLDDLRSWLIAQAMEFRERFYPPSDAEDVESAWYAILHHNLSQLAQNHFTTVAQGYQMDSPSTSLDWHQEVGSNPRMSGLGYHIDDLEPPRLLVLVEHLRRGEDPREGDAKDPSLCRSFACDRVATRRGFCHTHYMSARYLEASPCTVEDCDGFAHARGLCNAHYRADLLRTKPACLDEGCDRPQAARGLCSTHRDQYARAGRPYPLDARKLVAGLTCSVVDCDAQQYAKGMCRRHHKRQWRQDRRDAA